MSYKRSILFNIVPHILLWVALSILFYVLNTILVFRGALPQSILISLKTTEVTLNSALLAVLMALLAWMSIRVFLGPRVLGRYSSETLLLSFTVIIVPLALLPELGHLFILIFYAALGTMLVGSRISANLSSFWEKKSDKINVLVLFGVVCTVHAFYSIQRHQHFGSGSWDLGCMVHNFYLSAHGLPLFSTVLGNVHFLADHFMPGIFIYAPVFRLFETAETVLVLQAVQIALCAISLYLIARHRKQSQSVSLLIAFLFAFALGTQSASYFDAHELVLGFGFWCLGLYAYERSAFVLATLAFLLGSCFKESMPAYFIAMGLFSVIDPYHHCCSKSRRIFGILWVVLGTILLALVHGYWMPELQELSKNSGHPAESHVTYADFGSTLFEVATNVLKRPDFALLVAFIPLSKTLSMGVTLLSFGLLPLFAAEILLPALPLLAERFLSSKSSMWEMGYHYALPLTLYAGWAAIRSLERINKYKRAFTMHAALLAVMVSYFGYKHPANFWTFMPSYALRGEQLEQHQRLLSFIKENIPKDASIAAQDKLLAHLAARQYIYRLGDDPGAEFIVLSKGTSSWPYDPTYIENLEHRMMQSFQSVRPTFERLYIDDGVSVWRRLEHRNFNASSKPNQR